MMDYYYGRESEQYSALVIPKLLLSDAAFEGLSLDAKLLYGVLLDRMSLVSRNGWYDEENRAYIVYHLSDIQKDYGFSRKKILSHLVELERFGLIERKKRGRGLPNIFYVKNFFLVEDEAYDPSRSVQIDTFGI